MQDEKIMELEEVPNMETPAWQLVASGKALRRVQTEFVSAVAVQKPRDKRKALADCLEEAAIAGDEFYYSWTVKSKTGPQLVEGLSVNAALTAARNWGNCAIPVSIEEGSNSYIFTATFVDMETGFNLQRTYRQRKKPNIGMKDVERAEDITFQIGQSKAIRNVILNALPSWLMSKMLEKAKENVIEKIMKMGIAVAKEKTISFFAKYGITVDRIEKKMAKKNEFWSAEDLAVLQGAMNMLIAGQESAESLFPSLSEGASIAERIKDARAKELPQQAAIPPMRQPGEE